MPILQQVRYLDKFLRHLKLGVKDIVKPMLNMGSPFGIRVDPARKNNGAHKHYYDKVNSSQHLDKNGNPFDFGSLESHINLN